MKPMDPCLLATTGASTTPLWVAVAVLLCLGITVLAIRLRRGQTVRHRRAALLGGAAFALIACVALTPLAHPTTAQAATSQGPCVESATTPPSSPAQTPPVTDPKDEDDVTPSVREVTPVSPTLSVVPCGETPEVLIPEVEGVVYSLSQSEDVVTVTATTASGYAFIPGATTSWTFTLTVVPCPCVPDEIEWPEPPERNIFSLWNGTLTAYLTTWAQPLQDQGAIFSVHVAETSHIEGTWEAVNGLPEGVEDGLVSFDGLVETEGVAGQIIDGNLQFAVTSIGDTASTQVDQATLALNEQYPDAGGFYLIYSANSSSAGGTITSSITDTCGTVQTREFTIAPGGGGGNN